MLSYFINYLLFHLIKKLRIKFKINYFFILLILFIFIVYFIFIL